MALDFFDSLFDIDEDGELTDADDFLDFMVFEDIMNDEDDECDDGFWDDD